MKENERPEIFRGWLEECLGNLRSQLKNLGAQKSLEVRKLMANFCGVGYDTIYRWFASETIQSPIGENRFRILCCLESMGYTTMDLLKLKTHRGFAELLGYNVLSVEDAVNLLGYQHPRNVYRILRPDDKEGMSEEKEQKMWEIWKQRKEELEGKKAEARRLLGNILVREEPQEEPEVSDVPVKAEKPDTGIAKLTARAEAIVHIANGLRVLLRETSPEQLVAELSVLPYSYGDDLLSLATEINTHFWRIIQKRREDKDGE